MKARHLSWKYFVIFLIFSWSCEIEDNHGTVEFVLFNNDLNSVYGEPLGNYYTADFIGDTNNQEIYFSDGNKPGEILALNYKSHDIRKLYTNRNPGEPVFLVDYIPQTNSLYFWEETYPDRNFIALDVNTLKFRKIFSGYGNVVVSPNFVFLNYEYDSLFIKKIDRNGNEEILGIRGYVTLASQDNPELLIEPVNQSKFLIYNYQANQVRLTRQNEFNIERFYRWKGDDLFCKIYDPGKIKNLVTEEIFNLSSSNNIIIDFNPECRKVLYMKEEILDNSYQYQYRNIQLKVRNIDTGETDVPVNINSVYEYIYLARLLNDGKTVIYTINDKFYKAITE